MTAVEVAELVEAYMPLAMSKARRHSIGYNWLLDDLTSDACFALWKAARTWDPRISPFPHWACRWMQWAMLRRIRTERGRNPTAFNRQVAAVVVQGSGELVDVIDLAADEAAGDPAEIAELREESARLPELLDVLDEDRRELVLRHVVDGEPLTVIAVDHGTTGNNVSQLVRRSLAKMRKAAG